MNEKLSRTLLAIEAVILCLPLTALFIIKTIPATQYFSDERMFESAYLVMIINTFIIIGIISGWRLMLGFIIQGRSALKRASAIWWFISGVIAVCAIMVWIYVNTAESYHPSAILSFGWGIFFLPPYVHLLLELCRSK